MNSIYGVFLGPFEILWAVFLFYLFLYFGYSGIPFFLWAVFFEIVLIGFKIHSAVCIGFGILAVCFLLTPLRRFLSGAIMWIMQRIGFIPKISETERAALDAG